jgi:ornithine carbamoyltransferase
MPGRSIANVRQFADVRHAIFMHCLPAYCGEEVSAAVIDSPRSVVFTQAAGRLHTEKALLLALLG